jgi:isoquinoline 1-oxidoreductase beta subunit
MSHVTIHVTFLGGGFGRKSKADFVSEAVLLARECGCPVRVQWTREDDVQHDYYHTTSAQRLEAGLDDKGAVVAWRHRTAFPSISSIYQNGVVHASDGELQQGVTDVPLRIANLRAENGEAPAYVRIGWLRSVCNIHHAFAVGSFLDELAWARKQDPRESLLELFGPARHATLAELGVEKLPNYDASLEQHPIDVGRYRHVIERVTDLAGWSHRRSRGRALGLAVHRSFLSYVAVVVAVVPAPLGKIRVDEAWVVADGGTVINPERTRAQMEGAVIFGMSLAMYGQITMRAGAVEQTNFRDYRLVRMAEAPRRIAVEIVASEGPPGGIGEPGVPPVAPALANAIFAATGKRVRELPFAKAGLV